MSNVKYPEIKVKLIGNNSNAFAVMANVSSALRRGGVSKEEIDKYWEESTSGSYENLLSVAMKWVNVS